MSSDSPTTASANVAKPTTGTTSFPERTLHQWTKNPQSKKRDEDTAHSKQDHDKQARKFITERENNYIIGMGMAVDGPHVYFVDWHDKLWGLEVELSPSPTARCVVRPE